MKLIRMLGRGIRDAFKSVFRNYSLSIASISCISITLVVVAISLVVSLNVKHMTDVIKKDVTIVVFINQKATDLDLEQIDTKLRKINNIESLTLKTKEQEKKEFMEESEVFESIMSDWDEDESPLRDSFLIKVSSFFFADSVALQASYFPTSRFTNLSSDFGIRGRGRDSLHLHETHHIIPGAPY